MATALRGHDRNGTLDPRNESDDSIMATQSRGHGTQTPMQPMRTLWPTLLLLVVAGCSTHPLADTMDALTPGHLYPDNVRTPYGGVCIPQGPGVTGTTPAIPPPPLVPP